MKNLLYLEGISLTLRDVVSFSDCSKQRHSSRSMRIIIKNKSCFVEEIFLGLSVRGISLLHKSLHKASESF